MNKNTHYVIEIEKDGKKSAFVKTICNSLNLVYALNIPGIVSANACDTKKEAEKIAKDWNDIYIQKGIYMYA